MGIAISQLTPATTFGEADSIEIAQSGVSKKLTKSQIRKLLFTDPAFAVPAVVPKQGDVVSYAGSDFVTGPIPRWRVIDPVAYNAATPASTSQITFAGGPIASGVYRKAGDYFAVGDPVRTEIGIGTYYYGIVTAVTDTLLTITGAPLPLSPILSLSVGQPNMVRQIAIHVSRQSYANAIGDILGVGHRWRGRTGYLVTFSATHASTGQPKINVKCNGNLVSSNDASNGIQLSATPGTFVDNSAVAITAANYVIADAQTIAVRVTAAVASQDFLIVCLVFVVP